MRRTLSLPLVVLLCVFFYRAPSLLASGVTDPDYYWHVLYGEWILDHRALPTSDFWSWTNFGKPYVLTQWLGEVAMGIANQIGGLYGTSVLAAALLTLTLFCAYGAAKCFVESRVAALAIAVACCINLAGLACRPHQFTHLGLALLVWLLAIHETQRNRLALYAIPFVFAVWVNLHGGYAFGLLYLWLVVGCNGLESLIQKVRPSPLLASTALLATLATLVNPNGFGAWSYAIEIASLKSSSSGLVDEWMATTIKTEAGLIYFFLATLLAVSMASARYRPSVRTLALAVTVTAIGWTSIRVSLMASILFIPLIAQAVSSTPFYQMAFGSSEAKKYDRDPPVWVAGAVLCLVIAVAGLLASISKEAENKVASDFPVKEIAFMRANGIDGKILNSPEIGGYLLANGYKVSLDTRLDLYGDRELFEFVFARRGDGTWRAYVERMNPDIIMIDNLVALRELLILAGEYRLVFEGINSSILVRTTSYQSVPTLTPKNTRTETILKTLS